MRPVRAYLVALGYPDIDISDPIAFEGFYQNKLKNFDVLNTKNKIEMEAYYFFKKIGSYRTLDEVDFGRIYGIYEISSYPDQKQLAALMKSYTLAFVKTVGSQSDPYNEKLDLGCQYVVECADHLFENDVLTFQQYLDLAITIAKVAKDPKNVEAACHLKDWAIINKFDSKANTLVSYLMAAIGHLLNFIGISFGQKMILGAEARVGIRNSIFAVKDLVALSEPAVPQDAGLHLAR